MNARQPGRLPVLLFTLAALLLSPQLDASRALASEASSAPSYLETRIGASEIEGRDLVGALGALSAHERSGYAVSSGGSAAGEHLAVLVHNGGIQTLKAIRRHSERVVRGKVGLGGLSPENRARVLAIRKYLAAGDKKRAGTHFHSLNAELARVAQDAGHVASVVINKRAYIVGGKKSFRIPDYKVFSEVPDIKPWKRYRNAYMFTDQFLDLSRAGFDPFPLYYRLRF